MQTTTAQHSSTPAPAICIEGVSAQYKNKSVLRDVSLTIKAGETFGLIGLNGAGKTTLIKIILGLMQPSVGEISLFGQKNLNIKTRQKISYLPEKFEPPAFLSGMEFIRFSLNLYDQPVTSKEIHDAANRIALHPQVLDNRTETYSKGMRQKTGLIGTWLTGCPLLILDEPMSGLDPRARALVKDEIMACRARGTTVFLSSHILADMDEICDNIGIIHDGSLMFTGTPATLKENTQQKYLERAFLETIDTPSTIGIQT